jgi:hypothetical protein
MRMSENELDPARNTQQFQAFVQKGEGGSVEPPKTNPGLIIVAVVVLIVVLILAAVFSLL